MNGFHLNYLVKNSFILILILRKKKKGNVLIPQNLISTILQYSNLLSNADFDSNKDPNMPKDMAIPSLISIYLDCTLNKLNKRVWEQKNEIDSTPKKLRGWGYLGTLTW